MTNSTLSSFSVHWHLNPSRVTEACKESPFGADRLLRVQIKCMALPLLPVCKAAQKVIFPMMVLMVRLLKCRGDKSLVASFSVCAKTALPRMSRNPSCTYNIWAWYGRSSVPKKARFLTFTQWQKGSLYEKFSSTSQRAANEHWVRYRTRIEKKFKST